ncbi:ribosomal protein L7/L12 C-terminal domain-containing protein [Dunaliella salina]|uniref:Ribosomal protein L7/L12 C-terminal domain-containing protein n=1 Tax=Dunaliella salina TaxID=3046 RepID=A0ABQ7GBD3_DUNSA|nr:ribosomal protein L7/L12 C-terminal domain-containing protein [Dunaliella salina]|eukprot:KAF5831905.1 ribosomal protein L7/L12 C-terminal domain-containing protein [Dunaliella salina]
MLANVVRRCYLASSSATLPSAPLQASIAAATCSDALSNLHSGIGCSISSVDSLNQSSQNQCSTSSSCLGSTTRRYSSEREESEDVSKIGGEKVQRLAGELLGLTVLESSQLSTILRKKLDIPKPAFGAGAMPAFPMGAAMPQPGAGAATGGPGAQEAAAPEPAKEKTEFDVKLQSFSAEGKIKVIKEIRALTNLGLKEAKELVEKTPTVLKSGATKEEAENWKKVIESAGGKVDLA